MQSSLEFSEGTDDLEEQLAGGGCEIQSFRETHQLDAQAAEVLHQPYQVNQTAPQPVELPDQDDRELASLSARQQSVEPRARIPDPADSLVAVFAPDFKPSPIC